MARAGTNPLTKLRRLLATWLLAQEGCSCPQLILTVTFASVANG
jgi:hypothetical protein